MTTHTPGPWEPHGGVIGGRNSLLVCKPDATKSRGCRSVAEAETIGIPRLQAEANARLIAAAPDLLAASKALLSCRWMVETVSAEVDALREAVAKAEKGDA